MNHINHPQAERPPARATERRFIAVFASRPLTSSEHPALTRAREVFGTVPANGPHTRLRAGSFAFSV